MSDQSAPKRSPRRKARPKVFQGAMTEELLALEKAGVIRFYTEDSPEIRDGTAVETDWDEVQRILGKKLPPSLLWTPWTMNYESPNKQAD
jgi:hypothetical protein